RHWRRSADGHHLQREPDHHQQGSKLDAELAGAERHHRDDFADGGQRGGERQPVGFSGQHHHLHADRIERPGSDRDGERDRKREYGTAAVDNHHLVYGESTHHFEWWIVRADLQREQ